MSLSPKVVEVLVEHHRKFLDFLVPRVGTPEAAEELLQAAFVKGMESGSSPREEERVVAWFYRLLRNALVDAHRRKQRELRALEAQAAEHPLSTEEVEDLEQTVCGCVTELADTLKPEYAAILQRVDLEGASLSTFAEEEGITPNNAAVRLHRARQALGRRLVDLCGTCCTHGCVDCACTPGQHRQAGSVDEG
ncbi:RNA polymerase sigma factor [Archangium gephyra]|uniref:RNA polymerase sigma factor n=1 Tax=Archangium violaceum TaxID=83451 RepID=UPI002B2EA57D|nr:RNA polymerase sigma factor [Archangium gephyra]